MRIRKHVQRFTLGPPLIVLLLCCAACHDEQAVDDGGDGLRAITAQSAHRPMNGERSRGAYIGNISDSNPLLSRVITFNGESEEAELAADAGKTWCDGDFLFTTRGVVTAYDRETTPTTGNGKYPAVEQMYDTYYLTGLHPNDSWTGDAATKSSTLTHAITGCDDIMVAPTQTVTKADILVAGSPTLTFEHLLTKFEVRVRAKDADAAALWNRVTAVQMVGIKQYPTMPNTFGYTPDGSLPQAYTDEGGSNTPLSFYAIDHSGATAIYLDDVYAGADGSIVVGEDFPSVAYTLAPAFAPTNGSDVIIRVMAETTDEQDKELELALHIPPLPDGATTAGYAYRLSLTFADATTIIAIAEVIEWMDTGSEIGLSVVTPKEN